MANEDAFEPAVSLYVKATENDWRTVQATGEQAAAKEATEQKPAAQANVAKEASTETPPPAEATDTSPTSAAETSKLMNVARSILVNENGSIE